MVKPFLELIWLHLGVQHPNSLSKKYENMNPPGKGFEPLSADAQPFSRRPPYHLANLAIILGIVSQIKKSVRLTTTNSKTSLVYQREQY